MQNEPIAAPGPGAGRVPTHSAVPATAGTLLRYLFGSRRAILTLASDRRALWAGLLFVFGAALAREYDGRDLLREPWHLALPAVASLAVSGWIFGLIASRVRRDEAFPGLGAAYRSFLGLFWLTAPLALLYAIPYERFLSPAGAVRANLWTLGLVALWRVLLITRVLAVLTGRSAAAMFFPVMGVADVIAFVALRLVPTPVIQLMAGVQLTDAEAVAQGTVMGVGLLAVVSLPVWLIGSVLVLGRKPTSWQAAPAAPGRTHRGRGLYALAAASVLVWGVILPFTQREQRLRSRVERDLQAGRLDEALATMSRHGPEDFPPHWDPPPRTAYADPRPPLLDVMDALAEVEPAPWVRAVYLGKFERTYLYRTAPDFGLNPDDWRRIERLLPRLPEAASLERTHKESFRTARQRLTEQTGADAVPSGAALINTHSSD